MQHKRPLELCPGGQLLNLLEIPYDTNLTKKLDSIPQPQLVFCRNLLSYNSLALLSERKRRICPAQSPRPCDAHAAITCSNMSTTPGRPRPKQHRRARPTYPRHRHDHARLHSRRARSLPRRDRPTRRHRRVKEPQASLHHRRRRQSHLRPRHRLPRGIPLASPSRCPMEAGAAPSATPKATSGT